VNGSTQHAVQAAATTAVATAVPAALPPPGSTLGSVWAPQPHPGDVSDERLQDGPITLM
jgi:hypothetical protein